MPDLKLLLIILLLNLFFAYDLFQEPRIDNGNEVYVVAQEIVEASYCDLVDNARAYENKLIRVKAIYFATFDGDLLYSASCNSKARFAKPILSCHLDQDCKLLQNKLNEHLRGNPFGGARTEIVAVGRISITNHKEMGDPWGSFPIEFKIQTIEKTNSVSMDTPMPNF